MVLITIKYWSKTNAVGWNWREWHFLITEERNYADIEFIHVLNDNVFWNVIPCKACAMTPTVHSSMWESSQVVRVYFLLQHTLLFTYFFVSVSCVAVFYGSTCSVVCNTTENLERFCWFLSRSVWMNLPFCGISIGVQVYNSKVYCQAWAYL